MTPETFAFLHERKKSYQLAFTSPAGIAVLEDLTKFCRGKETCVVPGDRDRTYVLEGRREVYLRIQQHLELPPEELAVLYGAVAPEKDTDNG